MLHNVMWGGGIRISAGQRYEGVWSNVISITKGGGCQISKNINITLECPLNPVITQHTTKPECYSAGQHSRIRNPTPCPFN